ncbi:PEST proteolytic signal-containing nuclear protein-like [Hyposmocoma kahamanoa]|uniref:PEST proteolytic signal-containing nuclear protein-like n=1 Tax=Hyposmocoma kahamanoa TaxID=1477025 RepID=UPI000E6D8D95|nr:PEST proteolytic signal-containing nuclear protein-like [Hyposmocoma kahamanoa]
MSGRYYDYDKGSSRSTRDDSRTYKEREWDEKERRLSRSRSRSPHQNSPSNSRKKRSPERSSSRSSSSRDKEYDGKKYTKWDTREPEEVPEPPPPPRISKISIGFTKPKAPIKMSINTTKAVVPKPSVASVFNTDDDDDEEPEEMPAEAKMRMRNIGRETPTSAGPNSFGKTKQGFCDAKKVFEKNLKHALELEGGEKPQLPKFPQTIYKIKGP